MHFLILSHMIPFFPEAIRQFWQQNYQLRWGPVFVAGRQLHGGPDGSNERFEVFAPGPYRWYALDRNPDALLELDGKPIRPGQSVQLPRGEHTARLGANAEGRLMFAIDDPAPAPEQPFYAGGAIREIIGRGYFPP